MKFVELSISIRGICHVVDMAFTNRSDEFGVDGRLAPTSSGPVFIEFIPSLNGRQQKRTPFDVVTNFRMSVGRDDKIVEHFVANREFLIRRAFDLLWTGRPRELGALESYGADRWREVS